MASAEASQSSATETEVSAVRASYPGRCRVVKDVGDYSHVITVQPAELDATIKFQIRGVYSVLNSDITLLARKYTRFPPPHQLL